MLETVAREMLGAATRHLTGYLVTLFLTSCLLLCIRTCWRWGHKKGGATLPPGPWGIPLLGNLAILRKDFHRKQGIEWAKKYGPVFRIRIGVRNIVLVSDFELIKEILCKKECLFRPQRWVFKHIGGVGSLNGKAWQENRRYCVKSLRELSSGKKSMLEHVREEFQCLRDKVADARGQPLRMRPLLLPAVANTIAALVLGSRYASSDPRLDQLEQHLETFVRIFFSVPPVNPLPSWLDWMSPYIPILGEYKGSKFARDILKFVGQEINHRLDTLDPDVNRHFIDGYVTMVTQHRGKPDPDVNPDTLHGSVVDLLIAGSSTVAATILYILLHCAANPDAVQARIHEEIDAVVESCRSPKWEDHNGMPYTMAVIWEMYRWKTVSTLNLPREVAEDVVLNGYLIPKGTIVVANNWATHNDPRYWKNPERFDPSRFLTPDESQLLPRPEYLMPFSIGRRMCPGKALATVEIFLGVTTLLQKFLVVAEGGPSYCVATDPFAKLLAQGLCFLPRVPE
ncbi:cytochrome P450 2F2 [Ixodes scapularis]